MSERHHIKINKRIIILAGLLITMGLTIAQEVAPPSLTHVRASALVQSLKQSRADTNKVAALLQLATYNILKSCEKKVDLDSAAAFINEGSELNKKLDSRKLQGYITIVQSTLARERGDMEKGRDLATRSVSLRGLSEDLEGTFSIENNDGTAMVLA